MLSAGQIWNAKALNLVAGEPGNTGTLSVKNPKYFSENFNSSTKSEK
jgi:hypothetical protein